jgi:hypothetical protein
MKAIKAHLDVGDIFLELSEEIFSRLLAYGLPCLTPNLHVILGVSHPGVRQRTSAYVRIRPHTSAYVSIRHNIRQHTSVCYIRQLVASA